MFRNKSKKNQKQSDETVRIELITSELEPNLESFIYGRFLYAQQIRERALDGGLVEITLGPDVENASRMFFRGLLDEYIQAHPGENVFAKFRVITDNDDISHNFRTCLGVDEMQVSLYREKARDAFR